MTNTIHDTRYTRLLSLPAAGVGAGWKIAALRLANAGKALGYSKGQVFADIRHNTATTGNRVSDYDIDERIACAWNTTPPKGGRSVPQVAPERVITDEDRAAYRRDIVGPYAGCGAAELWEMSNPRPSDQGKADALLFLRTIYAADEHVAIGPHNMGGRNVMPVSDWIERIEHADTVERPHIMLNPLTGELAPKKSGDGMTRRGDNSIAAHRWVLLEFDDVPIEEQAAVCVALIAEDVLDIGAVISSGNKSLHAWVRVDCENAKEWVQCVVGSVYAAGGLVDMLGGDIKTGTPARLSRLPGHRRAETGKVQELLYLNTERA
jgi:hypothetical protein